MFAMRSTIETLTSACQIDIIQQRAKKKKKKKERKKEKTCFNELWQTLLSLVASTSWAIPFAKVL